MSRGMGEREKRRRLRFAASPPRRFIREIQGCSLPKHFEIFFWLIFFGIGNFIMAQQVTIDWKLYKVTRVRQVVTNTGSLNAKNPDDRFYNYPYLVNCEFPPGSFEEHLTEGGIWIGAVVGNDSLVSVTEGEVSDRELFPTDAPWDTVWVANRADTVNIPYWPGYVGISDQDLVCRYNDYGPASLRISNHQPLYIDVIQTCYAWATPPYDEFLVFRYYIIPRQINLQQVYLTSWINGNVGNYRDESFGLDDITYSRLNGLLQICEDLPGGSDGAAFSPVATKVYPPENPSAPLRTTFTWYNGRQTGLPAQDNIRYAQMSEGTVMLPQSSSGDGTKSMISVGPYEIAVGDTLEFTVALILGEGTAGVLKNAELGDDLREKNYRTPSPPPSPPLRVTRRSGAVTLNWQPGPGDINPETYQDPFRGDSVTQPFEGYRVYKSTQSAAGPWTLLAEFDIPDNDFGPNTGLQYEFTDQGLLDYFEYFYTATAFSKPDTSTGFPSQESSRDAIAKTAIPGQEPRQQVGKVAVVPNPYRGDIAYYGFNPPWEKPDPSRNVWLEQDRRILFINLPERCEIRIYTLAGDLLAVLQHNDAVQGYESWNLTSSIGQAISSGIYLFSVEDRRSGDVQVGKFVIIK